MLELDHLFVFCAAEEAAAEGRIGRVLADAGLVPTYSRRHAGQGTENICFCFDDAYLELLFVSDAAELAAPAVGRTGLSARARWRDTGASPFGIGLRGGPLPFGTWDYRFEGLPPGMSVPVASDSADVRQPFLFGSPGTERPDRWPGGRAGARQTAAGLTGIIRVDLAMADGVEPAPALSALSEAGLLALSGGGGRSGRLEVEVARAAGGTLRLAFPAATAG